MAARYGGEEFVVFLPDTGLDGVETVAQRLQRALALAHLPHPDSEKGRVSVSMGLAALCPSDTTSPAQLVQLADQALYEAKRGGRDGYRCA
jgi:diguanylate cyclase (GGDEF)-like protein